MRRGIYLEIVGILLALFLLVEIFEKQINDSSYIVQGIFIFLITIIVVGMVLLAMWDTKIIGKKE